ncbi:acyl-CoA dehydrogenase family protein [Streptomyces sp. NPDC051940]|uniref:acyl-CoA dehydrogenase family protein n=1 Tax=Streptomyces sp. NPDC051940 TaxID=3155675 RepID=UPI003412A460
MDPAFTEEQAEIRRTLRTALAKGCGPDDVRAACLAPAGHDRRLWHRLAGDLGLAGLAVAAADGGAGCTVTELALACEEAGRVLLPSPLLPTAALAVPLVQALAADGQRHELLTALAGGLPTAVAVPGSRLTEALALTGPNTGPWAGDGRAGGVQARRRDGRWLLYGEAEQVLGAPGAELLLVPAHHGGFARSHILVFVVRAGAAGLTVTRTRTLDETRAQGRVQLRDTEAELLRDGASDTPTPVPAAFAEAGTVAAAALAAEAVGAAAEALTATVEYVKVREQFGRTIGSFQAVQHRLADLYVEVEAARSAAYYAAWAAATPGAEDRTAAGPLALAQALSAQRTVAGEAIQLHGGIGFTWEHRVQLYFKRAVSDGLLFGAPHRLRAHAARLSGLFTAGEPHERKAVTV